MFTVCGNHKQLNLLVLLYVSEYVLQQDNNPYSADCTTIRVLYLNMYHRIVQWSTWNYFMADKKMFKNFR